jgi:hypothetical protein
MCNHIFKEEHIMAEEVLYYVTLAARAGGNIQRCLRSEETTFEVVS